MNKGSTLFLKTVLLLLGIGALAILIWFPQIEGRNANADLLTIYFRDPFLTYVYVGSIPFFTALYQAYKLLGYIERNKAFTQTSVNALRNIKYCAIAIICFIALAEVFILMSNEVDKAGGLAGGIYIAFAASVIATAAAVFQKLLQNAVDIKSENDLTV